MWAKVKAEAEELFKNIKGKQFKDCYSMRPRIMKHTNEMKNVYITQKIYSAFRWVTNAMNAGNPIEDVEKYLISLCFESYEKQILECKDIDISQREINK